MALNARLPLVQRYRFAEKRQHVHVGTRKDLAKTYNRFAAGFKLSIMKRKHYPGIFLCLSQSGFCTFLPRIFTHIH
jgi:hypothetical protein